MLAGCLVYDLSPRLVHHAATVGGCAGEARRRWLLRLRPRLSVRLGTRPVPSRPTPARLRARAGLWCRYRKVLLCPGRSVCRGRQPSVECCWGGRSSVLAWSIRARVRLPSRVSRFCGYGRGIVLRVLWSVCGCLCVPVGTTPPSSRPSVLPLLSAPSFVLAWARSRGDGKRRWCHVSALNATSRVWRLAVRCALISVDGGVGLFSWLHSTFRRFLCGLAAAPSSGPVQQHRCLGSK